MTAPAEDPIDGRLLRNLSCRLSAAQRHERARAHLLGDAQRLIDHLADEFRDRRVRRTRDALGVVLERVNRALELLAAMRRASDVHAELLFAREAIGNAIRINNSGE